MLPTSEELIYENMAVTIEPGIYLSGIGGARIEDMVLINAYGHEIITGLQKEEFVLKN